MSSSIIGEVQYRPMVAGDIPDLVAIESSWEGARWTREMFERELHLPMSLSVVAAVAGTPVGFAVLWTVADRAQLLEFAVAETHRRKGVGRGLISRLLEMSRGKGCAVIELELREDNDPARKFYEKLGFAVTGRRKKFYDMGQGKMRDAILMERSI